MATIKLNKTTALPGTLDGNSVYLVAPSSKPGYVEMYVTNADGSQARRIINSDDIKAMIDASLAAAGSIAIVSDISARDAISSPPNGKYVLVLDATGDNTVKNGAASYVWRADTSKWVKLTEYESMDMTITWDMIQGKPASSPSSIDTAVSNSHTHSNMTQLGKVGEDSNGDFTYNGQYPRARLDSADW
jgi:hypothetical protein